MHSIDDVKSHYTTFYHNAIRTYGIFAFDSDVECVCVVGIGDNRGGEGEWRGGSALTDAH